MISGSMVALVTPMLEGGALDWDKLAGRSCNNYGWRRSWAGG